MSADLGPIEELASLAEILVGAWHARAAASTTLGSERAILRLAGVTGLDRTGRPLAWAMVDQYLGREPRRMSAGILLPFAMAALEYDLGPQDLALDVAAGDVDLALEAEVLLAPDRRLVAEAEARRWIDAALQRIDANRTARRELVSVLGDAERPWIGLTLADPVVEDALAEAASIVAAGSDVVRVEVPAGRELVNRLDAAGRPIEPWRPRRRRPGERRSVLSTLPDAELAPAGSQRGLAALRQLLDGLAARRGAYVRLASFAPVLSAPEQAAVAAFERVDIVDADLAAEIVGGVDPDRALADHAFAHRLHARAGTMLHVGAGPLVVGPDLARGQPASTSTLAGRGLALQALTVAFAREAGVAPQRILVDALPAWVTEEPDSVPQALAGVQVRRSLFPEHPLAFIEPAADGPAAVAWPYLIAAVLPHAGTTSLVVRNAELSDAAALVAATRASARVAAGVRASLGGSPTGPAAERAQAMTAEAVSILEQLRDQGWRSVLGEALGRGLAIGRELSVERSDPFDAVGLLLQASG